MLVTQQSQSFGPEPINPPVAPIPTDRPLTITFKNAPYLESRRTASMAEIRKATEEFIPNSYPDHTVLPFHGFEHPYQVARDSTRFIGRIQSESKCIDVDVLYVASLLHDIFYKAPFEQLGFSSREHLAGHRTYEILRTWGASEEFARAVERTIYATDFRTTALTLEEKVMKAADLFNIADAYDLFKANAMLLHQESQLVFGRSSSFADFVKGAINYLSLYAFREIDASQWARLPNGASEWHVGFARNAAALYIESNFGRARFSTFCADDLSTEDALRAVNDPDTMYVIEADGEEKRERLLHAIDAKKKLAGLNSPVLLVPPTYGLKIQPEQPPHFSLTDRAQH